MSDVDLQIATEQKGLPSESEILQWVNNVLDAEDIDSEITVRIVDEEESQSLNHQYRDKDKPTNVLSFPFEAPPGLPPEACPSIGDLIICAKVVETEADQQNKALLNHWAHMVTHGCLHLLGYDHINDTDAELMESKEIALLAKLDIENPYIEQLSPSKV